MCSDSPSGDPTYLFFHVTAPLTASPCLSLAETFCRLSCVLISPQAGWVYHHCMAGAHSLGSLAKNWCAFAHALLLYPRCGAGCAWRNTHANCHWLVLLTLWGDWALRARSHLRQSFDFTSPFPPSGNEGHIRNRDVHFNHISKTIEVIIKLHIQMYLSWSNNLSKLVRKEQLSSTNCISYTFKL